jgi:GntR family transcriptional regulator
MATEGAGRQPKYQRIAGELREAIRAGAYAPGDRLPGENELMTKHGVARMTARQALGALQNEGLAESRQGAGVFVRRFRPVRRRGIQRLATERRNAGRSAWEDEAEGRTFAVDQLEVVAEAEAPEGVAVVLGLAPGDAVCVRRRRYLVDGKPVMTAASYLPARIVAGSAITRADTGPGGTYARLTDLGHAPTRFREEIRCRMPAPEETTALGLGAGTPVIAVDRTAYDAAGAAVEFTEMVLDSGAYVLEYDFDA